MTGPALVVHGHFYQPPRQDPFSGTFLPDPTAAPARDWNARIAADCYRPNAVLGNLGAMSWDLGPTLAGWLQDGDTVAYRGFVDGDAGRQGMAQPYHHTILPLASAADRRTEIRWGLRDFELRFGRRPAGMWLPETAVDLETLRLLADEGIRHTILAPWQVDGEEVDARRPARIDLGDGRSMVVAIYDGWLSSSLSFEPVASVDADAFVRERVLARFVQAGLPEGVDPLVVIATDGELYGHHQPFREHFLARLVGTTAPTGRPFTTPALEAGLAMAEVQATLPTVHLRGGTSWSCHHGVDRWSAACGCVRDGSWKAPLRIALERLAGGIDAATEQLIHDLPGRPDPWAARDAYVDVVVGVTDGDAFAAEVLGPDATMASRASLLEVLTAQRLRLAMFASCAWFWETPDRPETANAIRAATAAARRIDALAGTGLEARLRADLRLVSAQV